MNRIKKAQNILSLNQLNALVVDNPIDLYYLTGQDLSLGRIVISEMEAVLYVDGRYVEACRQQAFIKVMETKDFGPKSEFATSWSFTGKKIGFDSQYTSYDAYLALQSLGGEFIPLPSPIKKIREIKEKPELDQLRKAAHLCSLGYDTVLSLLKEGVTEEGMAVELEFFWKRNQGDKIGFNPHVAFGANSSQPHYHAGKRSLKKGDVVLIDIGVVVNHYHSDMTRVVFFGKPPSELEKIYHIVREAQAKALELCKAGVPIKDVDQAARGWIAQNGYEKCFTHSLGHGIGLEIHEMPRLSSTTPGVLEEGMVVTIEPGIYLPGIGGVRLEDAIIITQEGYENLTQRPLSRALPII